MSTPMRRCFLNVTLGAVEFDEQAFEKVRVA